MRFTINSGIVDLPDQRFSGEVVTVDECEAQLAVLEAEIEAACRDKCRWCDDELPLVRTEAEAWTHTGVRHGKTYSHPCLAYDMQERRYRRRMGQIDKGEGQ